MHHCVTHSLLSSHHCITVRLGKKTIAFWKGKIKFKLYYKLFLCATCSLKFQTLPPHQNEDKDGEISLHIS